MRNLPDKYTIKNKNVFLFEDNIPGKKSVLIAVDNDSDILPYIERTFAEHYAVHTVVLSDEQKRAAGIVTTASALRIIAEPPSEGSKKAVFNGERDAMLILEVLESTRGNPRKKTKARTLSRDVTMTPIAPSSIRPAATEGTSPELLAAFGAAISFMAEKGILLDEADRDRLLIKMSMASQKDTQARHSIA